MLCCAQANIRAAYMITLRHMLAVWKASGRREAALLYGGDVGIVTR